MSEATRAVTARFWDEVWNSTDLDVLEELFWPTSCCTSRRHVLWHRGHAHDVRHPVLRAVPDLAVSTVLSFSHGDYVADSLMFTRDALGHGLSPRALPCEGTAGDPCIWGRDRFHPDLPHAGRGWHDARDVGGLRPGAAVTTVGGRPR